MIRLRCDLAGYITIENLNRVNPVFIAARVDAALDQAIYVGPGGSLVVVGLEPLFIRDSVGSVPEPPVEEESDDRET